MRSNWVKEVSRLREENQIIEEALKFYAEREHYKGRTVTDSGEVAREALQEARRRRNRRY